MPVNALLSAKRAARSAYAPPKSPNGAGEAGARVLRNLLESVWKLLNAVHKVGGEPNRDPKYLEPVHQLRVLSRRASEALKLFKKWLPPTQFGEMRDLLRRIRKAADEARDLDVMILSLENGAAILGPPEDTSATMSLIQLLGKSRVQAQEPIIALIQLLSRINFPGKIDRLTRSLEIHAKKDRKSPKRRIRNALHKAAEKFFDAGAADLSQDAKLHQLRIRAKKLRYLMELIAPNFDAAFAQIIPVVTLIQELAGDIHDHSAANDVFSALREDAAHPHERAYYEGLLLGEMRAQAELRTIFESLWTRENIDALREKISAHFKA